MNNFKVFKRVCGLRGDVKNVNLAKNAMCAILFSHAKKKKKLF